jgi:hypothetical protein
VIEKMENCHFRESGNPGPRRCGKSNGAFDYRVVAKCKGYESIRMETAAPPGIQK